MVEHCAVLGAGTLDVPWLIATRLVGTTMFLAIQPRYTTALNLARLGIWLLVAGITAASQQ